MIAIVSARQTSSITTEVRFLGRGPYYPHMRERGSNGEYPQGRDGYKPARMYSRPGLAETFAGGRDCNSVHSRKNIYVLHDDGRSVDAKPDMDLWRIAAECRARFNFPTVMAPHIRRRLGLLLSWMLAGVFFSGCGVECGSEALPHGWGKWTSIEGGAYQNRQCTNCGYRISREINSR